MDCLGYVVLVMEFFCKFVEIRLFFKMIVVGVFIVNEENFVVYGVGVDMFVKDGFFDNLKLGLL